VRRTVSDRFSSSGWNGGRHRCVENFDRFRQHLDRAGNQIGVDRSIGARAHATGDRDAVLAAQLLGGGERRGAVGIEHDLHDPFAVAQVDEDDAAVIAAPMHPAGDGDRLPEVAAVDATAIISAFQ
jgi:hypothetical protein